MKVTERGRLSYANQAEADRWATSLKSKTAGSEESEGAFIAKLVSCEPVIKINAM